MSQTTATPGIYPLGDQKLKENPPPMPHHWVFKRDKHSDHWFFCWRPFAHFVYRVFCVIGLGHTDLKTVWETSYPGCPVEGWEAGRDSLRERLEHVNLVVRFRWSLDECLVDLDCDVWSRLVCSSRRWRHFARQTLLGTRECYHIRRLAPIPSSSYPSAFQSEA